MENNIKEIKTELIKIEDAIEMFNKFIEACKKEGIDLRGEHAKTLVGQRVVFVFDYDDIG